MNTPIIDNSFLCPECGKGRVAEAIIDAVRPIKYEGVVHSIPVTNMPVLRCDHCGDVSYDNRTSQRFDAAAREYLGILLADEITATMQKHGLTSRLLASITGTAEETISRWINGHVMQSRAMDTLLRATLFPELWSEYLRKSSGGSIDLGAEYTVAAEELVRADLRPMCQAVASHGGAFKTSPVFDTGFNVCSFDSLPHGFKGAVAFQTHEEPAAKAVKASTSAARGPDPSEPAAERPYALAA